ncbi:protein spire homolog 1-like isoform X2 [Amphiura filiformis]|uniref:protein spire homolog 1-like isoform X2 n=1 Tax=Amphiura filiformis TaxID=82378 RepID=UPI003B224B75
MAECSLVKVDEVQINCITLGKILDAFNGPLNEEQAWALCHQSAKFLGQSLCEDGDKKRDFNLDGIDSVSLRKDGTVSIEEQEVTGDCTDEQVQRGRERELVDALGRVIYQSLDYGFHAEEERELSHPLESLIDSMTISEDTDETDDKNCDDEGIEDGNCSDEDNNNDGKLANFEQVLQVCRQHITDPSVAPNHYQAVCRALVNECQELTTFLQKIAASKQTLRVLNSDEAPADAADGKVEDLQPREWARIWMMVLQSLRHGVQLKKVTERECTKAPIEYELTPYEIMMDDIRSRRYQLNKIMVNGDIPPRVKKEAHDIILDFIRSRPPLKPVRCHSWSGTKLMDRPDIEKDKLRKISHHERLLEDIRAQPKLLPVSQRVLAKKPKLRSRRRRYGSGSAGDSGSVSSDIDSSSDMDSFDESPEIPKRKLKAEVILDWSDDDDMLETITIPNIPSSLPTSYHHDPGDVFEPPAVKNNMYVYPERPKDPDPSVLPPKPKPTVIPKPPSKKLSAIHFPSIDSDPGSPDFSTLPPGVTSMDAIVPMEEFWLGDAVEEENETVSPLTESKPFIRDDPRRHSIGVCQSQRRSVMKHSKSSTPTTEFYAAPAHLSLTVDEVIHIRTVLVKAELENLRVNPKLYQAVSAEKVCFSCKNKFLIFKKKHRCKLCQRLICSVCCKKMHLPHGHFLQIPVDSLSPNTPKRRRRKKKESDYRGPETAEKFRSKKPPSKKKVTISEPPTPSISPIHLPKFWRKENETAADAKDDVCNMCKDFLVKALKNSQRTPTASPARTPVKSPNRTPTGSEQSTPTRRFSLDPAPYPPGLRPSASQDTIERENAANQGMEKHQVTDNLPKSPSGGVKSPVISPSRHAAENGQHRLGSPNTNNNKSLPLDFLAEIPAMSIEEDTEKPWGVNNDDEELQEVRKTTPQTQRRIPYII